MKCAIMQPTYLPWAGYFNLISKVDKFVFLDDVQFEKGSWQKRNRIIVNGKEYLLSIPTKKTGLNTLIKDIKVNNEIGWQRDHWMTLQCAYARAPFGEELLHLLHEFYNNYQVEYLADFNQSIILKIAAALGLKTFFLKASELNLGEKRSKHLVMILEHLGCCEYLSPIGSAEYLKDDAFENITKVKLNFQSFEVRPYRHYNCSQFIPRLSIVDVIANIGLEATKIYIS
jgi:hypothetical protein